MIFLTVQALLVVKYLLEGHTDDKHVIQALCDFLQTTDEEHADVKGLDKCTGQPFPPPMPQPLLGTCVSRAPGVQLLLHGHVMERYRVACLRASLLALDSNRHPSYMWLQIGLQRMSRR